MTSINNLFKGFKILGLLIILFSLFSGCARYHIEHADAKRFMKRYYYTKRDVRHVEDPFPGPIRKYQVYVHDDNGNTFKGKKNLINDTIFSTTLIKTKSKEYPDTFYRSGLPSYTKAIHIYLKDSIHPKEGYSELTPNQILDIEYYGKTFPTEGDLTNQESGLKMVGALVAFALLAGIFVIFQSTANTWSNYKKKECYVATLAYKDINAPEVVLLRKYRDEKLRYHFLGRLFIFYYYKTSPTFVYLVKDIGWLNKAIKWVLDKYVRYLGRKYGYELAV